MTPQQRLQDAQQRHGDAVELLATLQDKMVQGDEAVTLAEVKAHEDTIKWTQLQIAAYEKSVAVADAEKTHDEVVLIGREAEAFADRGLDRLAAAVKEAIEADRKVYDLAAEYEQHRSDLNERLREANHRDPVALSETRVRDLVTGHGFGYGFTVLTPDGDANEFRHMDAARLTLAGSVVALEDRTTPNDHQAGQMHRDLVHVAADVYRELPQITPSPDWRRTY